MPEQCRSCKADIRWAVTVQGGKMMPIDADSRGADDGTVLCATVGKQVSAIVVGRDWQPGPHHNPAWHRYRSHYASCPNAAQHRRN